MKTHTTLVSVLILALVVWAGPVAAQLGPGPFSSFPSEDETDARFLGFGCPGIETFESGVSITLSAAPTESDFDLNIFDGETTGTVSTGHWDVGSKQLVYRLYFDPFRQANTDPADLVGEWFGNAINPLSNPDPDPERAWTLSSAQMPDNDWWTANVTTSSLAQPSPGENFFYHLRIDLAEACAVGEQLESNIKIAASSPLTFAAPRFAFVAALRQIPNDRPIVYPGTLPPPNPPPPGGFVSAPTTYDGTFEFFINVPVDATEVSLFDGDFDHGTNPNSPTTLPSGLTLPQCSDTDDVDTPADYGDFPPALATGAANMEGAVPIGAPPDDNVLDVFRRGEVDSPGRFGCVRYEVTDSNGVTHFNNNPSGNLEWERWRVVSASNADAGDPSTYDVLINQPFLPAGVWRVQVKGLDMSNLNFWFNEAAVCALRPKDGALPTIDFENGYDNGALATGQIIDDEFASRGVHFSTTDPVNHPLMIFDSAVPTGGDTDLGSPNETCTPAGPGQGAGGEVGAAGENCFPQGNVLIISEDADSADPDDDAAGGTIIVTFDDPVLLESVDLMDIENTVTTVTAFDAGNNVVASATAASTGDNSLQTVLLNASNVSRLEISLGGSGAVSKIVFASVPIEPACPPPTYLVGDTVWIDTNSNGVQDPGEPGVAGVTVELYSNLTNELIRTFVTGDTTDPKFSRCSRFNTGLDEDGLYCFDVPPGDYRVEVAASNFGPGGPLEGYMSTTGGEVISDTVVAANVLTYDFGYTGDGSIGDFVWNDANNNAIQDDGPASGIGGVTVNLTEAGPDGMFGTADDVFFPPQVTAADGSYDFTDLPPGSYRVDVDESTLPPGLVLTTANEPDDHVLGLGEDYNDADFGYFAPPGSLGDRVWNDLDADGVQDPGEPGINGVTVTLFDAVTGANLGSTVTAGDGEYLFDGLVAGTYRVEVDPSTLPAGFVQTFDLDGLATPDEATGALAAAEDRRDFDFGYSLCGECDGKVTSLTLQYTGSSTVQVTVVGKRGPSQDTLFDGVVAPGGEFTVLGQPAPQNGFNGTLGTEIRIFVDGVHVETIHTSCSQPIGPGLVAGDFLVLAGTSRFGGALCPLDGGGGEPPPDCGCEGKVSQLELQYLGASTVSIEVFGNRGPDYDLLFSDTVNPGEIFEVTSTPTDLPGFVGTLGTEIDIYVDGQLQTTIHTSCSQPIGPGLVSGDFLVISGTSKTGGDLCPIDDKTEFPFCASGAPADDFGNSNGHAFWLPGISENLVFTGTGGSFVENNDGTATLTGVVEDAADSSKRFAVSVSFSGRTTVTPPGSPKKELAAAAYSENGGPVDTDAFRYYTSFSGTLTGQGFWANAVVDFSRTGPAFQVGNGASNKNVGFGASGWFDWTVVQQPAGGGFPTNGVGDINVDLAVGECPEGCSPGFVKDHFSSVSYGNNDGSDDWAGSWIENDVAGAGPSSGRARISGGFAFLDDVPDTGTEPSLAREVDLSGAVSATLSFAFDTSSTVDTSDAVTVEVSSDGGATWTTLEVITGIAGSVNETRSYDISAFISSNTRVRFRVSNLYGGSGEFFCLDWVKIDFDCVENSTGSIGDTVWNDGNGNGIQEDPSTGLSGVTVKLFSGGSQVASDVTDANGKYRFDGLAAGTYRVEVVEETLPADIRKPTYDLDGTGTPGEATVTIGAGESNQGADFGYQAGKSSPCTYCEHYTGTLSGSGDYDYHVDGTYFWAESGTHEGYLEGSDGTDYDLYLYFWDEDEWDLVAKSATGSQDETVVVRGEDAGYYMWKVRSYSGSGGYDLWLHRP